jgi:hypothetical protein
MLNRIIFVVKNVRGDGCKEFLANQRTLIPITEYRKQNKDELFLIYSHIEAPCSPAEVGSTLRTDKLQGIFDCKELTPQPR